MTETVLLDATARVPGPAGLGRYQILREIGRGTAGVVYQAHDLVLGHTVALKMVQPAFAMTATQRDAFDERFLREARIAARLSHPNVVRVHDFGCDPEGTLFIALEFLDGAPLSQVVSPSSTLLWPEALRIAERMADALHHAHSMGIVHRDVKPANVMLLPTGEPKLLDFGIAKTAEAGGHCTRPGHLVGTPLYMSPEQTLGRPAEPRSDVFALGAVLYFLITGRAPFAAATVPHVLLRVLRDDPVSPSCSVPGTPEDVDYVVARAMAKDPAYRYSSAAAMAQDLIDILARRPPRHRAAWTPPRPDDTSPWLTLDGDLALAELEAEVLTPLGTLTPAVSLGPALGLETAGGRAVGSVPPHRRSLGSRALPAAALMLAAAAFGYAARHARDPVAPTALTTVPAPSLATSPSVLVAAPLPPAPRAAVAPAPPVPSPATLPAAEPRAAHMAVELEHSISRGRLRLWIDDTLRLDQALDGYAGKRGTAGEVFDVAPGVHDVALEVRWDKNARAGRVKATFLPGENRRLAARLGGVLKKKMALRWRDVAPAAPHAAVSR
jgi:eukaryotic-like serine/threonine-protein kinase